MTTQIRIAEGEDDYQAFGTLIREYVDWCRDRYAHDPWFVDAAFGHQGLDRELEGLPLAYGAPNGKTLLALGDGQIVGACAYRRLSEDTCEMKRLFVPARHHGKGIGRQLCEALFAVAEQDGYGRMRLDTANMLTEAIVMYKRLGFRECPPYHDYPPDLMPYIVFMERDLNS